MNSNLKSECALVPLDVCLLSIVNATHTLIINAAPRLEHSPCKGTMAKEFYFICKCKYIRVFEMNLTRVAGFYWVHHHDGCWRLHSCWRLLFQRGTASHPDLPSCGHHCCASCLLLSGIYGVANYTLILLVQQYIVRMVLFEISSDG